MCMEHEPTQDSPPSKPTQSPDAPARARAGRKKRPPPKQPFGKQTRTPDDYARGHLKVDNMLAANPADRDAYYQFIRDPRTSWRSATEWLRSRGYTKERIGIGAIRSHLRQFRTRLQAVWEAAEMSFACAEQARQAGTPVIAEGAVTRFETLLTQALFNMRSGQSVSQGQWETMGKALNVAVANRARVEEVRRALGEARHRATEAAAAGADAADSGATARETVERMRQILGV